MARPTEYREAYAEGARKLARLGATDSEIADFYRDEPTEDDFYAEALRIIRLDRRGVIAAQKRKRAGSRKDRATPSGRVLNAVRARMWAALRGRSDGALFSRLGYSADDLMRRLEGGFVDGMGWHNYGNWHIDHIEPCAAFDLTDDDQFSRCWRLENLRPLWAEANIRKGAKHGAA